MKAITIQPGKQGARLVERPEPSIAHPDEIKLRIIRVGICGTDREEVAGGRAKAPQGQAELVIGHEMFGQVVEVGKGVERVQAGDYAVFTVRRGCGRCLPCTMNRSDMCLTGDYLERGIWGQDGFQTEYVVDQEQYVVKVPADLSEVGVLAEPLSISEKAIDEAVRVQFARLPDASAAPDWLYNRRCLVAGLGPVGLLAALALRLRGAEVSGLDIVDEGTARPAWLKTIGGHYVDGRQVTTDRLDDVLGPSDVIFEAAGLPGLAFNLLDALAPNGIYMVTGIPGEGGSIQVPGAQLIRELVLDNHGMIGSVNAARGHYQMAVEDLGMAKQCWGDHVSGLITHRLPFTDFQNAFDRPPQDEIKAVLEWEKTGNDRQ